MSIPVWAENAICCLAVTPGERVGVLVDEPLIDAGLRVCDAVHAAHAHATMTVIPDVARPMATPDTPFVASLAELDALVFWIASTTPSEFGNHRQSIYAKAQETGTRIAFGAEIDQAILDNELSADYGAVRDLSRAMLARIGDARRVRVTSPGGTDCTFDLEGRSWLIDDGGLGTRAAMGNLPAGEIYIAPIRTGADGVVVVDRSIAVRGIGLVGEPIRFTYEQGRIVRIEGGAEADRVREVIEEAGEGADTIAELGIGTNAAARLTGSIITDEKVLGTAHVAFGDNRGSYGGDNAAAIHIDGVIADASILVDDEVVIEKGVVR
jgi:leucyl aminopeptidase (aminopeptidase T)